MMGWTTCLSITLLAASCVAAPPTAPVPGSLFLVNSTTIVLAPNGGYASRPILPKGSIVVVDIYKQPLYTYIPIKYRIFGEVGIFSGNVKVADLDDTITPPPGYLCSITHKDTPVLDADEKIKDILPENCKVVPTVHGAVLSKGGNNVYLTVAYVDKSGQQHEGFVWAMALSCKSHPYESKQRLGPIPMPVPRWK